MTDEAFYEISGAEELERAFAAAPEIVEKVGRRAIIKATSLLEREVKERTPFGVTGLLRQSITRGEPYRAGVADMAGKVTTPISYAVPVELGSRPHTPPLEPLREWVLKKLGAGPVEAEKIARAIVWKIRAHGTKGAGMFKKAFEANRAQVTAILEKAAADILQEMKKAEKK